MVRRRAWRIAFGVLALSMLPVVVPGSPIYLPDLVVAGGMHDGHSTRYWIKSLDSPDAGVRRDALFALAAINEPAVRAVPRIAQIMLEDPDANFRTVAANVLANMAPTSRSAATQLGQALQDRELAVRMGAAVALFRLKEHARPALPAMLRALKDPNNQANVDMSPFSIEEMLLMAVGRASAGDGDVVPAILETLGTDPSNSLLKAAARALGDVGGPARSAAPQLRAMLKNNSMVVRQEARMALKNVGASEDSAESQSTTVGQMPDPELPESERKYLWEVEHHGNVLVKFGFGALVKALKAADASALSRILSADFTGSDLLDPRRIQAVAGAMQVERLEDAGRSPVALTRAGFVERLLKWRGLFAAAPPQVKFALMTLGPKVRGKLDGVWECTTQLRLNGEQTAGAPAEVVVVMHFEFPRPSEEVFSRPGWLRAGRIQQVQIARAPRYLFADVTKERGFDASKLYDNWKTEDFMPSTGGVYVCDFDRDGILDVLITDFRTSLYHGRPDGKFEDVTAQSGLPQRTAARPIAAWIDIDGDGWDDLILAGRVFRNEQGKQFAEVTDRCNLHIPGDAMNIIVADYDRDGRLDLYVTRTAPPGKNSWLEARSGEAKGNILFHNLGDWQFENTTQKSRTFGGHRSTFTAAWLDANNDGWPDLHVINEFGDGGLMINNHDGTFTEHALADYPADFGSMGLAVGDINNDGNIDIFCANMYSKAGNRVIGNLAPDAYSPKTLEKMRRFVAGSQLHLNKGGLKFEQVGKTMQVAAVGWSYGACLADLDNDGWLDIYATAGYLSRNRDDPDG